MEPTLYITDNTKKVITLLKELGPLSKKELLEKGDMGWATVVKIINQLVESEIVTKLGTEKVNNGLRGKRAYLYDLTGNTPLGIGIDIEYQTTTMILTNLKGEILCSNRLPTIVPKSYDMLEAFLLHIIKNFLQKCPTAKKAIGIGIGMPGIDFPKVENLNNINRASLLEERLQSKLGVFIKISDNTKAYAIFEKWSNKTLTKDDFIFLSIRSGIGSGIFYHNKLIIGTRGLAGEIGHIQVIENGDLCRCGKHGCLETVAGERILFEQYVHRIMNKQLSDIPRKDLYERTILCIEDLFKRYGDGQEEAKQIVNRMVYYIGYCLALSITVLDIPNIVLSGHFGKYGNAIVEPLKNEIKKHLLAGTDCNIRYIPFDPNGHVLGAALLVLKDFFINIKGQEI